MCAMHGTRSSTFAYACVCVYVLALCGRACAIPRPQHQQQHLLPLVPLLLPNLVLLANGHKIFDRAINVRVGISTTLAWEGNIRVIRVSRKRKFETKGGQLRDRCSNAGKIIGLGLGLFPGNDG